MTSENNIFSFGDGSDPVQQAKEALQAVRQYQQAWQEQGVERVHQYFDDVEGNWLEEFDLTSTETLLEQAPTVTFPFIHNQLKALGLSSSFIRDVAFPSWWEDRYENDTALVSELLNLLSRRLCLKIDPPQNSPDLALSFLPISITKFKLQRNQETPNLFSYLARSITNTICSTIEQPYLSIPYDASVIRESILHKHSRVSLESLLDFCWISGIPVVHFDKKPDGHVKSDGLVVMSENRPTIVIGSSRKHSSWLLFILAHELGHIAKGHLQEGVLVDETFAGGMIDAEEEIANQFASQLMFGDISFQWPKRYPNALLAQSNRLSEMHNIDPGAIILNYAWQTGDWKCAMAALNRLEPHANAPTKINAYYQSHLTKIDEESRDYLERVNILSS